MLFLCELLIPQAIESEQKQRCNLHRVNQSLFAQTFACCYFLFVSAAAATAADDDDDEKSIVSLVLTIRVQFICMKYVVCVFACLVFFRTLQCFFLGVLFIQNGLYDCNKKQK